MTSLKKGDFVKVIVFDQGLGGLIPEDKRHLLFEVNRRWTKNSRSWYRAIYDKYETFVEITCERLNQYGDLVKHSINIPVEHVIKTNSKIYQKRDELLKGGKNGI